MKILLMVNNLVGWQIAEWLKEQGDQIVGIVLHEPCKRKYGDEIIGTLQIDPDRIFDGSQLRQQQVFDAIRELKADIAVSVLFDYILRPDFIKMFPFGVINLHSSYLPYNRGQYPNVWSIIDGTPAGVSLHYMDDGIDTGDMIAQKCLEVEPTDTGETLFRKIEVVCVEFFKQQWPLVRDGRALRSPQPLGCGTVHRTRDVDAIDEIDLEKSYIAKDLINILRARTFPPYTGAYFKVNGRRVYMQLQLKYDDEE